MNSKNTNTINLVIAQKNTSVQSNGDIKITSDRVLVLNDEANVLVNK